VRDAKRIAVVCADDHQSLPVAAFVYMRAADPGGSPDEFGKWSWRWDNEPALPKLWGDQRPGNGIPRFYGQPKAQVTGPSPNGGEVRLRCPRGCPTDFVMRWVNWCVVLDRFAAAEVSKMELRNLDAAVRYALGERGAGRG
jgi:hypothetical protein